MGASALQGCTRIPAADSSALYARNLANFLTAFWDKDSGAITLPDDDEIVQGVRIAAH